MDGWAARAGGSDTPFHHLADVWDEAQRIEKGLE